MRVIQNGRMYRLHKRHWLNIGLAIVLLILASVVIIIFLAGHPMRRAEDQSIAAAENHQKVTQVDDFYSSDLNHVFYTVKGVRHHRAAYVIMNKHYRPLRTVSVDHGVSQADVTKQVRRHDQPKKITNAAPAVLNGYVVWIVSFESRNGRLNYQTFRYKNGHSIQLIKNL